MITWVILDDQISTYHYFHPWRSLTFDLQVLRHSNCTSKTPTLLWYQDEKFHACWIRECPVLKQQERKKKITHLLTASTIAPLSTFVNLGVSLDRRSVIFFCSSGDIFRSLCDPAGKPGAHKRWWFVSYYAEVACYEVCGILKDVCSVPRSAKAPGVANMMSRDGRLKMMTFTK